MDIWKNVHNKRGCKMTGTISQSKLRINYTEQPVNELDSDNNNRP